MISPFALFLLHSHIFIRKDLETDTMSCVYKHTFPNGAVYIGRTNMSPEDRWLNGWGYKNCPLMFNAILKYGWDNVIHEIIADDLTEQESIDLEAKEIALHSTPTTMIYNIQSIPAQSLAQENAHFIDPNLSSPQDTLAQKHLTRHNIPLTTKPQGMRTCPITVYTTDGKFICTYPSAKVAAHELGVNHGDIISCCKGVKADGKMRYQVKGYVFRYSAK